MKILITGGAGFIPSSLADHLLTKDHEVILFDNLVTGKKTNIPSHKNCLFIEGDVNKVSDIAPVFQKNRFDFVFHYAALVGVQRTLDNPLKVLDDIQGFKNILDLSKDNNVKRVFYSSSSEVYGEPVFLPQNEDTTPLNSKLPYAVVKNVGESYFKSYQQTFGLDYTIFRFFNTFGPKQSEDFVMSKFITLAINNDDITIYGKGDQTRTFCYIDDNIEACMQAMDSEDSKNKIYNIGNDQIITIKELAEIIIRVTGSKSKIIHLPPLPEGDMTRRQPDITKMKELLNHELTPIQEGIFKVVQWKLRKLQVT